MCTEMTGLKLRAQCPCGTHTGFTQHVFFFFFGPKANNSVIHTLSLPVKTSQIDSTEGLTHTAGQLPWLQPLCDHCYPATLDFTDPKLQTNKKTTPLPSVMSGFVGLGSQRARWPAAPCPDRNKCHLFVQVGVVTRPCYLRGSTSWAWGIWQGVRE